MKDSINIDTSPHVCCDEHRRQLGKFQDLAQVLPTVDMSTLAVFFARQCQHNKKAARTARRMTAITQRSMFASDDKGSSPFHIVDRLLAAPTGIYGMELTSRPFHDFCTRQELISSFERYEKALTRDHHNVIPYAFDIQLKHRSLSFLTKIQRFNRLNSMTRVHLRETKINRVMKGSVLNVRSIVDPIITSRSIQLIVEDDEESVIRLAIYNWHTILADQSDDSIRNRVKTGRHFLIGNPFVKVAADALLILRVDDPRLEIWFTDYEKEIEQMDAERLRDLGNKFFHNDEINAALEYYSLGLHISTNDTRILSNRAECYLQSHLPQLALKDCEKILETFSKNHIEENRDSLFTWKIHYRKMRALIALQFYDQAKLSIDSVFQCTQENTSGNGELAERLQTISECDIPRLQKEAIGDYDMWKFISKQTRRSDESHAEFERENVWEFRQCDQPEKGFGMFALCSLKPGTLLLVERPFAYVPSKSNEDLVDENSHVIPFSLTQKAEYRNNSEDVMSSGGRYLRQPTLQLIREIETGILIDHQRLMEKLSHLSPLRQQSTRKKSDDEDYYLLPYKIFVEFLERNVIHDGLWPKLSRLNHSCLPNCFYLIINQFCFLSVIKPIQIGEELTICYLPSIYSSYIERTLRLREYHIDECRCELCEYDRKIGQAEMQQICQQFEDNDIDEDRRRYLFKYLLTQYGSDRPLGFVEQMSALKRSVHIDIFLEQVKHGYLAYPYILKYLLAHRKQSNRFDCLIRQLQEEFAYFKWTSNDQIEMFFNILDE